MNQVSALEAFSKMKPKACLFVVSIDGNERPNGMIVSSFMTCSMNPPMIAVSLSKRSNTRKMIEHSKEFVVAVANKDLESDVKYFGSHHGDEFDKFEETNIKTTSAMYLNSPLIKEATINMECYLEKSFVSGDQVIMVGKVLSSYVADSKKILFNVEKVGEERYFQDL